MVSLGRTVVLGVLVWLLPFVVAVAISPLRESSRPLFESLMAVTVTAVAVLIGLLYARKASLDTLAEGLTVGLVWFAVAVLIDAPLMLLGGPMLMTFAEYLADVGSTYLCIPVITMGLAAARASRPAAGA
jgi:hypothetical protein